MLVLGENGRIGEVLAARLEEEGHSLNLVRAPNLATVTPKLFQDVEICFVLAYDLEPVDVPFGDTEFLKTLRENALSAGVSRIVLLTAIRNAEPNKAVFFDVVARVETILGGSAIPITSFRSSILLDPEMVFARAIDSYATRHSSPVLPPEASRFECQPILLKEAVEMIIRSADHEFPRTYHFDIGGNEKLSYQTLVELFVNKEMQKNAALGVSVPQKKRSRAFGSEERQAWNIFLEKTKDNMLVKRESAAKYFHQVEISPLSEAIYKV